MKLPLTLLILSILSSPIFALCGTLTSSYTMLGPESSLTGTCFIIANDNITLNCAGNTITNANPNNNGYAVYNYGYDNFTALNCIIRNFQYGFYLEQAEDSRIINSQLISTRGYGIYGLNINRTVIQNARSATYKAGAAMGFFGNANNLFVNASSLSNILDGTAIGLYIGASNDVIIQNSEFGSRTNYSLIADNTNRINITGSTSTSFSNFSITLQTCKNNYIYNTTSSNTNHIAVYISGSNNTMLFNTTAKSSGWDAFHISESPFTYIINSTALTDNLSATPTNPRMRSIFLANSNNITIANSTVSCIAGYGVLFGRSNSTRLINSTLYSSSACIPLDYEIAKYGYVENITAISQEEIAVYINDTSSDIFITGLAASSTNQTAIYLSVSSRIQIYNSTARSNRGMGFASQAGNYIVINNLTAISNFSHGCYFAGNNNNLSNSRCFANGSGATGLYLLNADITRIVNSEVYSRVNYGIYALGSFPQISDLTIINSTSSSFTDRGLFAYNARNLRLFNSTFNSISYLGAEIFKANATVIGNSTFIGNQSGFFVNQSSVVLIANSTATSAEPAGVTADPPSCFSISDSINIFMLNSSAYSISSNCIRFTRSSNSTMANITLSCNSPFAILLNDTNAISIANGSINSIGGFALGLTSTNGTQINDTTLSSFTSGGLYISSANNTNIFKSTISSTNAGALWAIAADRFNLLNVTITSRTALNLIYVRNSKFINSSLEPRVLIYYGCNSYDTEIINSSYRRMGPGTPTSGSFVFLNETSCSKYGLNLLANITVKYYVTEEVLNYQGIGVDGAYVNITPAYGGDYIANLTMDSAGQDMQMQERIEYTANGTYNYYDLFMGYVNENVTWYSAYDFWANHPDYTPLGNHTQVTLNESKHVIMYLRLPLHVSEIWFNRPWTPMFFTFKNITIFFVNATDDEGAPLLITYSLTSPTHPVYINEPPAWSSPPTYASSNFTSDELGTWLAKFNVSNGYEAITKTLPFVVVADRVSPAINCTEPLNNSIRNDTILIECYFTDDNFDFSIYATNPPTFPDDVSNDNPHSYNWDTLDPGWPAMDGNYLIRIVALDVFGNSNDSILNISVDNTAPIITCSSPLNGTNVTDVTFIVCTITDAHHKQTNLTINTTPGTYFETDTSPLNYTWVVNSEGLLEIFITANDTVGQQAWKTIQVYALSSDDELLPFFLLISVAVGWFLIEPKLMTPKHMPSKQ